jgi:hypothetical protein
MWIGFPDDPSKSVGSVYGDVGALVDFAEGVEATLNGVRQQMALFETLFQHCDTNFKSYGTSIQHAIGNATLTYNAATAAQNAVHGLGATGTAGQLAQH